MADIFFPALINPVNSKEKRSLLAGKGYFMNFWTKSVTFNGQMCLPHNIHLMYGPEGNRLLRFPKSPVVVEGSVRTRGKTKLTTCSFLRDQKCVVI